MLEKVVKEKKNLIIICLAVLAVILIICFAMRPKNNTGEQINPTNISNQTEEPQQSQVDSLSKMNEERQKELQIGTNHIIID